MQFDLSNISIEMPLGGQGCFLFHTAVNDIHVVLKITPISHVSRLQVFSSDLPRYYLPHISASPYLWYYLPHISAYYLPHISPHILWIILSCPSHILDSRHQVNCYSFMYDAPSPLSNSTSLNRATLVLVKWQWVTP